MSALPPVRLQRVCRYALRPPRAQERLHRTSEGEIWLTLRRRWADGTTHLRFDPLELLERLAVLTPRPQVNLILYYGVLAARGVEPRSFRRSQTESMLARRQPRKMGTRAAHSAPGLARLSGPS